MFVIVNVGSDRLHEATAHNGPKKFETERGAKGACTRLNKTFGYTNQWKVVTNEHKELANETN